MRGALAVLTRVSPCEEHLAVAQYGSGVRRTPWRAGGTGCRSGKALLCWEMPKALALAGARAFEEDLLVDGARRGAEPLQCLGEDLRPVLVAPALLHVGQMRLVRLVLRRGGRVGLVLTGRQAAARAVPQLGNGRVARET